MRALSLIQPMGWAIVNGHKPFENRAADMRLLEMRGIRCLIAIHNSAKYDDDYANTVYRLTGVIPMAVPMAVIGVATLTGRVFTKTKPPPIDAPGREWFTGPVAFEIDTGYSVAFERPIPCKGALGFWPLPEAVERQVRGLL